MDHSGFSLSLLDSSVLQRLLAVSFPSGPVFPDVSGCFVVTRIQMRSGSTAGGGSRPGSQQQALGGLPESLPQ